MIGEKIKELRAEKSLTQEQLAKELQISRSALSLYEIDVRDVPNALLPVISKFFGVSIDYLFGLKDD